MFLTARTRYIALNPAFLAAFALLRAAYLFNGSKTLNYILLMSVNERFRSEPFLGRSFQEINNTGSHQSSEISPSNFRIRHIAANQDRMIITMNTWVLEIKRIFSALQEESAFKPLRPGQARPGKARPGQARPRHARPSQRVNLGGGGRGDLREAQIDVPLSVSHSCVSPHSWAQ